MPIAHVLALYLVTAQVLCNQHGSLEHEIPRRSFLSRRAIDGTRGRTYFDPEDSEGAFDSYGSAGGRYDPYEEKTDLSDIRRNVPGEPGLDYPAYTTLPQTGFTCEGRSRGYYADEDAGCQVFHVCHDVLVSSFLCPIGSTFSQKLLTCDWWTKVDCSATRKFIEVNRNSYQVDDDEMIRNAYAMITLQSGKDLTRDGLVDPDRSGRVFDFVPIDTTGNDVPNEYEDYNGVQHYSTNYDDYKNRYKTKTSPSYQNNFHSPRPQNHLRDSSRYQDSEIIRIQKYDDPRTKDASRTSFNRFQPSYAPTVPTVTTTTRRFYSPTVPTTFRPSTVSYNKLDLSFESSDHLYSHSKEDRDHVTPPTFAFKSGRDDGRSRQLMREEDFYDEDEKAAESVERQTYVLSNSTKDDSSFETEDFETRESIGLARALGGAQKNKLLERSGTEKPRTLVSAWTGIPILTNSDSSVNSEESTKSPEKDGVHNSTRTSNDKAGSEESSDFYDPDIGGTTTASYESQEIASTQAEKFETEETTLRPTTIHKSTVQENYFHVENDTEILEESATTHYQSPREELADVGSRQSADEKKEISSRIDSQPVEFLKQSQTRFRINIPERASPQTPNPNRFSSTTESYPTAGTTEIPNLTTIKSSDLKIDESLKGGSNSENRENSEQPNPTISIKGPRFHSTIRIGVHQADSHRNSKEFSPIGSLHYDYGPKKESSKERGENEKIVSNREAALSRDFIVDLPVSDIVPPIIDYNDGYDDFLAPNEEIPQVEEKKEVTNNSEVQLLSKYNPDLKFTIRGAAAENERNEGREFGTLTTTPKPQISTRRFDENEKAHGGKIIPLREAIQKFISPNSDNIFSSTPASDISESTQSGILNSSPFGENFGTTPPSDIFDDELFSRRSFDTSRSTSNVPSTINPVDFARSISTSFNANGELRTQGPATLRPFKSEDDVRSFLDFEYSQNPVTSRQFNSQGSSKSVKDSEFTTQNPTTLRQFNVQGVTGPVQNSELNSKNPVTHHQFSSRGTVGLFKDSESTTRNPSTLRQFSPQGSTGFFKDSDFTTRNPFEETDVQKGFSNARSDKNIFDTSAFSQNPSNQDKIGTTVNPVQFINDRFSSINENYQGHRQNFNSRNNSSQSTNKQNVNNYNQDIGFSTTARTFSDFSNFNREFIESTIPTTSKTFDNFRNAAENYATARTLSSDIKDRLTATENSRKSSVTQRSVDQSKKENNFETETSTSNNLFRSFRLESLKDIEDTIEQSKSPYQVSLTVNKDEDPGDDFIARLIAQHANRNFSNDRIDDFEIIRSVDPDVLNENPGNHNHNHDSNSNFELKYEQNNFGHSNNNYNRSNVDDHIDRRNFSTSSVNYDLRNDSSSNNHRESNVDVNFGERAKSNLNNGSGNYRNYNNNNSGTNYHARLSDHGREYNYTVSVTNSTSVKIGNHPLEFKRDSKLSSLSLLQLMAELLKIDRLPRPFALQDPDTVDIRPRSESKPEIIDLRTKPISSPEINFRTRLEPNTESNLRTRLESVPEPNLRTKLESTPESSFRTRLESIPETNFKTKLESIPEADFRPRLESTPETNLRTRLESVPEPNLRSTIDSKPEFHLRTRQELKPEFNLRPRQESKPEFNLRRKSESNPEVDLRTKLFLSSESLASSQRPLSKNLESLDLLSGFDLASRSSSNLENAELRPRSTQSTIPDSVLSQNQNLQHRSNLEAVEVRSRGNSNFNDVPTTTHKSILTSSHTDQSNKNDSKLKESLETSASRNVRPLKKEQILEQLAEHFGEPIYKIDRRPIFDLPNVNRDVDFRTGHPINQENVNLGKFDESLRIRPLNSDLRDDSDESLSADDRLKFSKFEDSLRIQPLNSNSKNANIGRIPSFGGENFESDFKVTPSKAIDFNFKGTSPSEFRHSTIASTFQITSPNPVRQYTDSNSDFSVTNFESAEKSKPKSKDAEFEEFLKVTPRVTTESPRLTTTSTTTESTKTIVETEFVPSIGFSFDTDEGREEYVEAVLGGLIHGPRKESDGQGQELGAKNDTKRV